MTEIAKARVFMSGRSQHVTIPREFRFRSAEVSIRRDERTGEVILTEAAGSWDELFAELDATRIPADFLAQSERALDPPQDRRELDELLTEQPGKPE